MQFRRFMWNSPDRSTRSPGSSDSSKDKANYKREDLRGAFLAIQDRCEELERDWVMKRNVLYKIHHVWQPAAASRWPTSSHCSIYRHVTGTHTFFHSFRERAPRRTYLLQFFSNDPLSNLLRRLTDLLDRDYTTRWASVSCPNFHAFRKINCPNLDIISCL